MSIMFWNMFPRFQQLKIFKDKNIYLDTDAISLMFKLIVLYQQIVPTYDPQSLLIFNTAIKNSLLNKTIPDPSLPTVLLNFYKSFLILIDMLIRISLNSRQNIIRTKLNIPSDICNTIKKYDFFFSGQLASTLKGHESGIIRVKELPDNKIISASEDLTLRIWDLKTQENIRTIYSKKRVVKIKFNGKQIIGEVDGGIIVWNYFSGEVETIISTEKDIISIKLFSKKQLIIGFGDGELEMWNILTGQLERTFDGHSNTIQVVKILKDGRFITGSSDTTLKIWNPLSPKPQLTLEGHTGEIACIKILKNGKIISSAEDGKVIMWNSISGKMDKVLLEIDTPIYTLFTLDDNTIVCGSLDNYLHIINIESGFVQTTYFEQSFKFYPLPNNTILIPSRSSIVFDYQTGEKIIHNIYLLSVSVLSNGIVLNRNGSDIQIWI